MKTTRSASLRKVVVCFFMLIFTFSLLGCSNSETASSNSNKPKIIFADASWDSIQVHNRIAGFILENGYGYSVDYTFGETLPTLQGLAKGDIDVIMEVWVDNCREAWDKMLAENKVINLGTNFPDAPQGWYVPTYLIKGDPERGIAAAAPDLKSIADLSKYKDLFQDPEVPDKGRFHQSPPGWVATTINEAKFQAYGLDKSFNLFSTGSDTALATSMVSAYEKGEPWLGYYWEPTWVMGKLDMTLLEEPQYDEKVWNKNYGCAYPNAEVVIGVNSGLEKKAPELIDFFKNYETTLEQNNKALAFMSSNNGDKQAAALDFLQNNAEIWKKWIPADVAAKVEKALAEVK